MFRVELIGAGWVAAGGLKVVKDVAEAGTFPRDRADWIAKAFHEDGLRVRLVEAEPVGHLCEGGTHCEHGADSTHWVKPD